MSKLQQSCIVSVNVFNQGRLSRSRRMWVMDRPGLLSSTEAREAKISRNPTRSNATQRTDFLRKAHLRFQRRKLVGGFSLGSTHLVLCRQWLLCCHSSPSHSSRSSPSTSSSAAPSTSSTCSSAARTLLSARRCTGDYGGRTDGQVPTGIERYPTQRLLLEESPHSAMRHILPRSA